MSLSQEMALFTLALAKSAAARASEGFLPSDRHWLSRQAQSKFLSEILRHRRRERLKDIPWQRVLQPPHDRHWQFPLVAHVRGRPEEAKRAIDAADPPKQKDVAPHCHMLLVARSRIPRGRR